MIHRTLAYAGQPNHNGYPPVTIALTRQKQKDKIYISVVMKILDNLQLESLTEQLSRASRRYVLDVK